MQTILRILEQARGWHHGLYLKIENPPYMTLVIEATDESGPSGLPAISVCHYGEQNGDLLHAMLQDGVDMFTADGAARGCHLVLSTFNCTIENRGIQEYLSSLREQTRVAIEARIRRGQVKGELARSAPVNPMAAFYATVLHGLSIQARDGSSRQLLTSVVKCSMDAWDHLAGKS